MGANFVANETDADLNGHGTHVAATVAGKTFGVAKKTNIIGVKILAADGSGETEDVLRGMQWVFDDARKYNRTAKSIINMSIGADRGDAEDDMVRVIFDEGILLVAAAGNDDRDASLGSPGGSPYAFTVGAMAVNRTRASFSNWGPSVNIFAPGVSIVSAAKENNGAVNYKSGTSQASPHVAGLAAYVKSVYNLTSPNHVVSKIEELALKDVVLDTKGATNLQAFNGLMPNPKLHTSE